MRRKLIRLWERDLAGIDYEGDLVPGLPKSVKAGIMRGQGVCHGEMPVAIRSHPGIHQLLDIVCEAVGKLRVFAVGGVNYVSSAGGVLFTSVSQVFRLK